METWKNIIKTITTNREGKKKHKLDQKQKKAMIGNNIYEDKTLYEFNKNVLDTQYKLKYKLLIPVILIIEKLFLKKILVREYKTTKWHNEPMQMMDETYEAALKTWLDFIFYKEHKKKGKQQHYMKGQGSTGLLRLIKNIALTIMSHDNVYTEFMNMWMYEIRKYHPKRVTNKHLLYTGNEANGPQYLTYYVIGEQLVNNKIQVMPLQSKSSQKS